MSVDLDTIDRASIEFGLDDSYGMVAPVDLAEVDYRTLLLGMKPDRTYHFRIVVESGSTEHVSEDYVIVTGPNTSPVAVRDFNIIDDSAREPGFIVASYWQGEGSSVAFILDRDGEIVWYHDFEISVGDGASDRGICRARMSADGKHMWMVVSSNQGGTVRSVTMDSLNEVAYEGTVGSHDITPVSGATMAYLDYGENDCDSNFEIDPSGNPQEVAEGTDFVNSASCHGNALRYSEAEDVYTFSDVNTDIYIVERSTGQRSWRLTDIVESNDAWGGTHHGHHLLDDTILIFGNRGGEGSASIVKEYTLGGAEILSYDSGLSAVNLGDVQRLPGGNTLVSYSNDESYIHEIDRNGNVVLEIDLGAGADGPALGYTLWRAFLYGPPSDISL